MTKRICLLMAALALALTLAACGGTQKETVSQTASGQTGESVSQGEGSQSQLQPEPRAAEESSPESSSGEEGEETPQEEALVLVQEDSGAEAGYEPAFTLYPDGTFSLFVSFYDGTATITGSYTQQGDSYVLTAKESTAQGVMGSDVGEITLTPEGEGYVYSGSQLGVIFDGAVFMPSQG